MTPQWTWAIDGWILLAGVLCAVACALLGNYLVLRRMSLMGDAISHAVLPGIAAAFIVTQSREPWLMFGGAVIVGVLTAMLSEAIRQYGKVEHGAALGVVFSVMFAAGLILIRRAADHVDIDPGCVLYGNITLIPLTAFGGEIPSTVQRLAIVAAIDLLFVLLFYKELKISSFDPALADTLGIHSRLVHYALMILVAVTTVACFEAVGSILVIAMLIVPAATAYLLTDRLGVMIVLSSLIGAASAVLGHRAATHGPTWIGLKGVDSVETSAMIAVTAGLIFLVAIFLSPRYGVAATIWNRVSLAMRIVREDILGLLYRWQEMRTDPEAAMAHVQIVDAVGRGWLTAVAIRLLRYRNWIVAIRGPQRQTCYALTGKGITRAARLVRSHRLWESYLARHFNLPLDHLHMPAERLEHFMTPTLTERLEDYVGDAPHDPHGRELPDPENP